VARNRQYDQPRAPARGGRKRGAAHHAIGRSRGGPSTKVHLVVDALGLPVAFTLTEGQRNDITAAPDLATQVGPRQLLADKGYDADAFRAHLAAMNCVAQIPSKRDRATKHPLDRELYKARSEVECTFNLLKQARRFATRYEKTRRNYASVVAIGCALLWLRL
jgi:transposase